MSERGGAGHGFGIVGTGTIGAFHAAAIATVPNARLAAATDVIPDRAESFAVAHGCAAEPSLDALLGRTDVDMVSVCVPSGRHADVGIAAARAGKNLVIEKPIDVSLAAADRLIEAAEAAGVTVTVISQHRFDPGLAELRRLIRAGARGRLHPVCVERHAHADRVRRGQHAGGLAHRGRGAGRR